MKSVKEITAIISKLSNQAAALEKQGGEFLDHARELFNSWRGTESMFANRDEDPEYIKYKALHAAADNAYIKAGELKKIVTVWKYNLLHAKKAELLPIWAGVMNEYQGKQIGAIREKEIREKLKAAGVAGYFSKYAYSSPKISLSYLDKNGNCYGSDYVELSGDYNISFFDDNNKFLMPDLSSFKFYGENIGYIDNPKTYIKKLERAAEKAKKAAAIYDSALHEYNTAAIPGFTQIDYYKTSPDSIAKYFHITK